MQKEVEIIALETLETLVELDSVSYEQARVEANNLFTTPPTKKYIETLFALADAKRETGGVHNEIPKQPNNEIIRKTIL